MYHKPDNEVGCIEGAKYVASQYIGWFCFTHQTLNCSAYQKGHSK